jgi:putative addiction module antidote
MEDPGSDIQNEGATLQICAIGDTIGVALPKEFVARFNLKEGDKLYPVQQPDGSIRLAPFNPKHARAMEIARKMMREYRDTFVALAR